MSILIGDYTFTDPTNNTNDLRNISGVYVILCKTATGYTVIDVGESGGIKDRIESHDRKDCWKRKCPSGKIYVAVYYTTNMTQTERRAIEKKIRDKYSNLCGSF